MRFKLSEGIRRRWDDSAPSYPWGWLLRGLLHPQLYAANRAQMIITRAKLLALLFAVATLMWLAVDFFLLSMEGAAKLSLARGFTAAAFLALAFAPRMGFTLGNAYGALARFFAVATGFFVLAHWIVNQYELTGLDAALASGYVALPFVMMVSLAFFPLTVLEVAAISAPILLAQAFGGYLVWEQLSWPSFLGASWLTLVILVMTAVASVSQLALMLTLVQRASRDPLTGALSRHSGIELADSLFASAARTRTPFSVLFVDLDHFKSINDSFGHDAGDSALAAAALQIQNGLRKSDALIRWGGEEFLILLPGTAKAQAMLVYERVIAPGLGMRPDGAPLTASVGIAERESDEARHWGGLVEIADKRMYIAKAQGRARADSGRLTKLSWQSKRHIID